MPALLADSPERPLSRLLLILAATATLLSGCGRGAETDDSQVAVRVNKGEISTHQIQTVLQRQPRLLAEQPDTAAQRVLEVLIDQELAAQAGREQGLDSDPAVVQSMEAARREVLARAYQDRVAAKAVAPSTDEVDRYYQSRPALFAQRRLYTLQETVVEAGEAQREALQTLVQRARGADELGTALRSAGFGTRTRQLTQAAEDLPLNLVDAIAKLEVGGSLLLPQAGGARIFTLLQAQSAPVDRRTANGAIVNFLTKERQRELVAQSTAELRKNGTVTYQGAFAKATSAPASAASAAVVKP